jgi:hypothetical protein
LEKTKQVILIDGAGTEKDKPSPPHRWSAVTAPAKNAAGVQQARDIAQLHRYTPNIFFEFTGIDSYVKRLRSTNSH